MISFTFTRILSPRLGLVVLLGLFGSGLEAGPNERISADSRAAGSLEILLAGNARFAAGRPRHPDQSEARRKEIAGTQEPFAIVLTCADSRVSPEIYFDQGLGDLFVIRNAGNVLGDEVLGSMEYAVGHLHVPLILVVGHERCGAVSAAVAGGHAEGHVSAIVEAIAPAVAASRGKDGDPVDNAVMAHAQLTAAALRASGPILSEAVKAGQVKVVAARYDLDSGRVTLLADLSTTETQPASPVHPAHASQHGQ